MAGVRIVDVLEVADLALVPPCADPRFDHRTCDYWEDADRGARDARPGWLTPGPTTPPSRPRATTDNPFAPTAGVVDRRQEALAALFGDDGEDGEDDAAPEAPGPDRAADPDAPDAVPWNPFAPAAERPARSLVGLPRKLALLSRGRGVFGSYARVALDHHEPVAYVQFGPLSAYPRAQRHRALYPQLPSAPLPAVITCIATTREARGGGHARRLVEDVCAELARRGFSAIEVYPDLTQSADATSAAVPAFWTACGFTLVAADERYPVLRRELT